MSRTQEQIDSDIQLEAAISKNLEAYGFAEDDWRLGDYVVCLSMINFGEDSIGRTRYAHLIPGEGVPYHVLLGLMDVTRIELDQEARG